MSCYLQPRRQPHSSVPSPGDTGTNRSACQGIPGVIRHLLETKPLYVQNQWLDTVENTKLSDTVLESQDQTKGIREKTLILAGGLLRAKEEVGFEYRLQGQGSWWGEGVELGKDSPLSSTTSPTSHPWTVVSHKNASQFVLSEDRTRWHVERAKYAANQRKSVSC